MSATSPAQWGRRLSDQVRSAVDAGDFESARQLIREGDGQARNLGKEFALMYKGLGITIRILLELLKDMAAAGDAQLRESARKTLGELLLRFRSEMIDLLTQAYGKSIVREEVQDASTLCHPCSTGEFDDELACTARLLAEAERLFSDKQERLAKETLHAIEAGNAEQVRALLDRKEQGQYVPLHDRLVCFMAEIFGYVLERFGPADLFRFHLASAEQQRQGFEKWERLTPAEFAQATAFLLKQHMGILHVREDEEKFTIEQTLCGSGGRLRLTGAYAGPEALPFVEECGPLTLGQERFPVYCSHCPIWNGVAPIKWFGHPHWVFENPSRADGSCTLHIYKRADLVPAAYYRQLGFAEPVRG